MTPYVHDPDLTLWLGDVREVLPRLEAESVDCLATSPPFYALRDYGVDGQIGLEATPDEWVAELVAVFRECRRLLKQSGTLWVECGDSYAATHQGRHGDQHSDAFHSTGEAYRENVAVRRVTGVPSGYKPKDLIGAPWLLAFALRADGWYLRQCIIWHKPNAMPESVKDRCTTAHSYVFLPSKSPRYWFDSEAIAEPAEWARWGDQTVPKHNGTETAAGWIPERSYEDLKASRRGTPEYESGGLTTGRGFSSATPGLIRPDGMKNPRSVWTIPTRGYSGAHFATWPEALAERIIKAGCPEWVCGTCGVPRTRITEAVADGRKWTGQRADAKDGYVRGYTPGVATSNVTTGWSDCGHDNYRSGVILDPFGGAGTTALVARRLGRKSVLVELNEQYAAMAAERLSQLSLLAAATP